VGGGVGFGVAVRAGGVGVTRGAVGVTVALGVGLAVGVGAIGDGLATEAVGDDPTAEAAAGVAALTTADGDAAGEVATTELDMGEVTSDAAGAAAPAWELDLQPATASSVTATPRPMARTELAREIALFARKAIEVA
jgi:hypothetical protein